MPSRHSSDHDNCQKGTENEWAEGPSSQTQKSNKRDREENLVHSAVAVSPDAKQGSIVAYMAGSTHPTTPRRGKGKKKTRADEDRIDEAEDEEIQNTFDSIRKADAAAKQTLNELDKERKDQITTENKITQPEENITLNEINMEEPLSKLLTTRKEQDTEHHEKPPHQVEEMNENITDTHLAGLSKTTDDAMPPKESQNEEEPKTDLQEKNTPTEKTGEKQSSKPNKRKKKPSKKKRKQKQSHILEAGPNGKAQLAGSAQTTEDTEGDETTEQEVTKDKAYYDKLVSDRTREFNFRINFTLLLTDSTGTTEEKKSKALTQLKEEIKNFHLLDPTVVLNPWWKSSPLIAPPLTVEDFNDDTTLHRYCKTIYIGPNTPEKARINMHIGTSMHPNIWEKKLSNHLLGGHHGKIYRNTVNASDEVQVGYAVMSTRFSNISQMAKRISATTGISIGMRSGPIILASERKDYYNGGYDDEAVQALHFYSDREDKARAIEKLDELLTGEYSKTQILTCPLIKFSLKPGEITGKHEEHTHQRLRKRQYGFTQNISIQEISGQIIGSIDEVPEGQKYSLQQLILRLKNNDTRTSHLYPQLFYDVDKVGESGTTRFIFLTCMEKQAILAAKNILAVLIRNYGNKKGIKDRFTYKAQDDAASNPWSNAEMKTTGERAGYNGLSNILCNMCKTEDDDISDDLSSSDMEYEEGPQGNGDKQEFIPLERRVIREMREFQGTHPSGGASFSKEYERGEENDIDIEPPQFDDERDFEDNKTAAPTKKKDDMSTDKSLLSCFTRRPDSKPAKSVAFADLDDFSDAQSLRTLVPPDQPTLEENQDDTDTSDFSYQSYNTNKKQ